MQKIKWILNKYGEHAEQCNGSYTHRLCCGKFEDFFCWDISILSSEGQVTYNIVLVKGHLLEGSIDMMGNCVFTLTLWWYMSGMHCEHMMFLILLKKKCSSTAATTSKKGKINIG